MNLTLNFTRHIGMRFALLMISIFAYGTILAQQPFVGCWHPQDIREWSPQTDRDAYFNRAKVPLATRIENSLSMRTNEGQYPEGGITDASIVGPMCSALPSQGTRGFIQYQPTYWQYIDKFVHWAGSASEGIIIPPPAPTVDAAHAQGVKVLGQIFFPPKAFGGKSEWVTEMLTTENGKYPYARKLYEIAAWLGFDGWFINEETNGGTSSKWKDFIADFYAAAAEAGDTNMEIQWYNASLTPNLNILGTNRRTSQFLEYGSVGDLTAWKDKITYPDGTHPDHVFDILYAGIECVQSGLTGYGTALKRAFPTTGHVGSVALFCPEEHTWRDNVRNLLNTPSQAFGQDAWNATKKTFENEEKMWVNATGDPSKRPTGSWPGISGCVMERSAITTLPFVADMNVGVGKHRFENGQILATGDWCHSGMQSVLPTWRWWIENGDNLSTSIDWDNAWQGGSSFKIAGRISAGSHLVRLYKTAIPTDGENVNVKLVYRGEIVPTLEVSTTESLTPDLSLTAQKVEAINGWKCAEYTIPSTVAKIFMVGIDLKSNSELNDFTFNLGELMVYNGNQATEFAIENLANDSELGVEGGDLRLTWASPWTPTFDHFNIYVSHENGDKILVGQTRDDAFYVPDLARENNESSIHATVIPVMFDGSYGTAATIEVMYPTPTQPEVGIDVSRSYLAVGQSATLTMTTTGAPTSYRWDIAPGLTGMDGTDLNTPSIEVKAMKAGEMEVEAFATNNIGTGSDKRVMIDVYESTEHLKAVQNVARSKTVVDFSECTNNNEHPRNILDGVTKPTSTSAKWCSTSPDNYVVIDLGEMFRLYGVRIYDGSYGPESGVPQIASYTVSLSADGVDFHTVLQRKGVADQTLKDDCFAPEYARYLRLDTHTDGVLRIWELEVLGSTTGVGAIQSLTTENPLTVTGRYTLTGISVGADFKGIHLVRYSDGSVKLMY